jgi:2-phosphoglycerate kinase
MVVLLGGAPRAGKGIISRQLVLKLGISLIPLDMLKMGLSNAVPSLGIDPSGPSLDVSGKMWPLVRAMAENALESGVQCIFEGDMIVPKHVAELREIADGEVHSCFVGYTDIDPERKLEEIRRHAGYPNDWLNEHDDHYILELVEYGIGFSRYLAQECDRLDFRYFDCSTDSPGTMEAVVAYLVQLDRGVEIEGER